MSFWNNTVSLGIGKGHKELSKLSTSSGEAEMND